MTEEKQAHFEGWARVEVMGHQTHVGFVRTEAYGAAVLFRIDSPPLPEREYVLQSPEYVDIANGQEWTRAGATVKREATEGGTVLIGAGSIYRIIPCTEAAALKLIEQSARAALRLISAPPERTLPAPDDEGDHDLDPYDEDREEEDEEIPL